MLERFFERTESPELRERRKTIERAVPLAANSPDGTLARATGTVRVVERGIVAPASGRVAVICAIEAADDARDEPGWAANPPYTSIDTCPFILDCDVGSVMVVGDFAELVDVPIVEVRELSEHWQPYCDARGLFTSRVAEAIVQPGQRITIAGIVDRRRLRPGTEAGFRDAPTGMYLVGDFDHPLLVRGV